MPVKDILALLETCLERLDLLNAYYRLFGVFAEDIPTHIQLWNTLISQRESYRQAVAEAKRRRQVAVLRDEPTIRSAYQQTAEMALQNIRLWNEDLIRVRCSDRELKRLALKAATEGSIALTKVEVEGLFDFTRILPAWDGIPSYTTFLIGGGIRISSPEFDAFHAMCWCHDEALRTGDTLAALQSRLASATFEDDDITRYQEVVGQHSLLCRETVLNAFLLIEAFINGIAFSFLERPPRHVTPEEEAWLREQRRSPDGATRSHYVPIEEKLHGWIRAISPRGETFDKGRRPYQAFVRLKNYRDALVHFSAKKLALYRSIDLAIAREAARTATQMIEAISAFVSPDGQNHRPFWLKHPDPDGRFNLSWTMKLDPLPAETPDAQPLS